jgi:hypothetical protein
MSNKVLAKAGLLAVVIAIASLVGSQPGCGGSSGGGTGGSGGGSAGAGGGGAGAGGHGGTGGSSGGQGGTAGLDAGAGDCSTCTKAEACCAALPSADGGTSCNGLANACNSATGTTRAQAISACQAIIAIGQFATPVPPACQ